MSDDDVKDETATPTEPAAEPQVSEKDTAAVADAVEEQLEPPPARDPDDRRRQGGRTREKGELLIAAAERSGVHIPRFCYHPRLRSVGMCRMCLVEVDTGRGPTLCAGLPRGVRRRT